MRLIFWLLVLANLVAAVYFNQALLTGAAPTFIKPDLNAEQLKILSQADIEKMPMRQAEHAPSPQAETPAAEVASTATESSPSAPNAAPSANTESSAPATTPPVPTPPPAPPEKHLTQLKTPEPLPCYEWAGIESADLGGVQALVDKLNVKNTVIKKSNKDSVRYWVYKPALESDEAAQKKAEELHAMGITDFFVVKDPKWRNAISFGVFRDEQLADNLVNDLKRKGLREVVKAERGGSSQADIKLFRVQPQQYTALKKNESSFSGGLKSLSCPK